MWMKKIWATEDCSTTPRHTRQDTKTTQWGRSSKRHSFTRWWYHFRIIPQSSFAYHIFVMLPEAPSVDTVDKYAQHSGLLKMHCTLPLVSSRSRSVFFALLNICTENSRLIPASQAGRLHISTTTTTGGDSFCIWIMIRFATRTAAPPHIPW